MNMDMRGETRPAGSVSGRRIRTIGDLRQYQGERKPSFAWRVRQALKLLPEMPQVVASEVLGNLFGSMTVQSRLRGVVYRPDFARLAPEQLLKVKDMLAENFPAHELLRYFGGDLTNYGLLSTRLVTDNGVAFLVDAIEGLAVTIANMKFHGFGTGTTNEAQSDSALVTELTTEYVTNSTRPTGSQSESSAPVYVTVGTLSPDSGGTLAITEHGIFSANASGVLLDRSKFAAVNLVASADSLQVTYSLTFTAGG